MMRLDTPLEIDLRERRGGEAGLSAVSSHLSASGKYPTVPSHERVVLVVSVGKSDAVGARRHATTTR